MREHDFKKNPELTNSQLAEFGFSSPHAQITEDFEAVVDEVIDGDTVMVSCSFRDFSFPIRFRDVDAPEMSEGGEVAKSWLECRMPASSRVRVLIDRDNRVGKYGRLLGAVLVNGMVVADEMLYLGLVRPFGKKKEGEVPALSSLFSMRQWFPT